MGPKLYLTKLARVKLASLELATISTSTKNKVLASIAKELNLRKSKILAANELDVSRLDEKFNSAFRDRLRLTHSRIDQMIHGLRDVIHLNDPVGEVVEKRTLKNKLVLSKCRSPLGAIFMIFESRPNVITEAFSLGFKAGNVMILRGGKESIETSKILYGIIHQALKQHGLSSDFFLGITDSDRSIVDLFLKQKALIDVVIPRGGESLIEYVVENSSIPIIKNDRGMCHVYVHSGAKLDMAIRIVDNAKTSRPGVCNSMETLLIDQRLASEFLPQIFLNLAKRNVHWHGCKNTIRILRGRFAKEIHLKKLFQIAKSSSWDTEYLDLRLNCKVIKNFDEAIAHISKHGSKHSEAIVTKDKKKAGEFMNRVDAAAVYWNASTRFTDGFEFGLGGEIGISTQKLHVRGPVGLNELTSFRWKIVGTGQIRN